MTSLLEVCGCFYYVVWGERFLRNACASAHVLRSITNKNIFIFLEDDVSSAPRDVVDHLEKIGVKLVQGSARHLVGQTWAYDYMRFHESSNLSEYPACYLDSDFLLFRDTEIEVEERTEVLFLSSNWYDSSRPNTPEADALSIHEKTGLKHWINVEGNMMLRVNNGLFIVFNKRCTKIFDMAMRYCRLLSERYVGEHVSSSLCNVFEEVRYIHETSLGVSYDSSGKEVLYYVRSDDSFDVFFDHRFFAHHTIGVKNKLNVSFENGYITTPTFDHRARKNKRSVNVKR